MLFPVYAMHTMFSATDVANFLACQHTATLDRAESRKEIKKPFFDDPAIELLQKLGLEHEKQYLRHLIDNEALAVTQIDVGASWDEAAAETIRAMHSGVPAVYQATFLDGPWRGRGDFLVRVDRSSALGLWSYEVVDTKLARSTKSGAVIQLCFYSDLLSRIQELEPERMYVVLGGGVKAEEFIVQRYIAYYRRIKREYQNAWKVERDTYPEPTEHCEVCSWYPLCDKRRRDDDHLSLVAGISRNQRKALGERSVSTMAGLAALALPVRPKVDRIGEAALFRIREQARLQVMGREQGKSCYEMVEPIETDKGLASLPSPSGGDLFLDFESNPYVLDQGLEYLIGFLTFEAGTEPLYESLWAFKRAEEKKAFEDFIEVVMDRWQRDPAMHIYHYAPYEPTAIKRLAGRHGTCVDEVDELLRAGIFVDLYRVVRQSLRASVESYSIKRLEPLYEFSRAVPLREANVALNTFEAALVLGGQGEIESLLKTIKGYNQDDCVSTLRLREWLEALRTEHEARTGQAIPRPQTRSGKPGLDLAAQLDEVSEVKNRLVSDLPDDEAEWNEEERARWLLAQMLEWHRREEKSAWWEYFRLCGLSDDELQEDKTALGGLEYVCEAGRIKRSVIHRYRFPPQDHAIDRALEVRDPRTQKSAGDLIAIDDHNRTIDLKRGAMSSVAHPTALIPFDIVDSEVLRGSLLRVASAVADTEMVEQGIFQSARDLLLRRGPRSLGDMAGSLIGTDGCLTESARQLVRSLSSQPCVLPIQGPPGSGKTYSGARMIVELVGDGRRVGITAVSHKVITNLLHEVCRYAADVGVPLRAIQKCNDGDQCREAAVTQAEDNQAVSNAIRGGSAHVAAGTAWLWARPEMANSVDVLFLDEAGQISLANTLAVSQAATSIVLLGDPQQLDQPQRGIHPPGAEVSALGHLLDGRATISAGQGLFLTETRRLHPEVCSFISEVFYDGRLLSRPENAYQRLNCDTLLDGTGLRFSPVEHTGNENESPEEVERLGAMVEHLLQTGATWSDKEGMKQSLRSEDVLVVAPYNAQVAALVERLPQGTRVGTVDKFQGQEAPVVFYSLATSTPEDAPRGMEFLYSLNRLNVAVSRARCVAVLVASPKLFQVECRTPRQIELANAFCRYLELAQVI
jgi:predicted RecB family nuclease